MSRRGWLIGMTACSFAALWLACSSDGASSSGGSSSGSGADSAAGDSSPVVDSGGGGADARADAPVDFCNELEQLGAAQSIVVSNGKEPAPGGGTISEGTYVGAGAIAYTTLFPDGANVGELAAITLTIKGNVVEELTSYSKTNNERSKGTFATTGSAITITQSCQFPSADAGLPPPTGFTATATTLSLFTTVNGIPAELKLTKK